MPIDCLKAVAREEPRGSVLACEMLQYTKIYMFRAFAGLAVVETLAGRVGWGQEMFEISRVGSVWVESGGI